MGTTLNDLICIHCSFWVLGLGLILVCSDPLIMNAVDPLIMTCSWPIDSECSWCIDNGTQLSIDNQSILNCNAFTNASLQLPLLCMSDDQCYNALVVGIKWRKASAIYYGGKCIVFLCTAADHPTGLAAERLQQDSTSFRVLWTPPAFSSNLTGYRIYYSGANDSGSVDVDPLATNVTIEDRITGVTYNITMVALSPHLPSPLIGPATVTPGESLW